MYIMGILTKQTDDEEVVIGYIFDIFSKFGQVINKEQLSQIAQIFMDSDYPSLQQDIQRCENLTK